jgi:hypothetical protein
LIAALAIGGAPVHAADCTRTPAEAAKDRRVGDNPLLAAILEKAPDRLPGFLCELDGVTSPRSSRGLSTGPQPTSDQMSAIRVNPAVANAYERNPDAMLELLRRMMEAAQGGARKSG